MVPRGRRKRARATVVLRVSGKQFWRPGSDLVRKKGIRRRGGRGLYIGAARDRNGQGLKWIKEGELIRGGNSVSGEVNARKKMTWPWPVGSTRQWGRARARTGSGKWEDGPRTCFVTGPKIVPGAPFLFLFLLFSFSFFVFLFLLYLLHIWFKLLQTNFVKFLKFKKTFQNSNNYVFINKTTFSKTLYIGPNGLLAYPKIGIWFGKWSFKIRE
jgi:hypothetical protein